MVAPLARRCNAMGILMNAMNKKKDADDDAK